MGDKSDPASRQTLRRKRFVDGLDDTANRLREQLPSVPVIVPENPEQSGVDGELRTRCEVILEQVAEINGILTRDETFPDDYARECRDRLVDVARSTEEILGSVVEGTHPPASMSAWLLRLKRHGRSIISPRRKAH